VVGGKYDGRRLEPLATVRSRSEQRALIGGPSWFGNFIDFQKELTFVN
jgi:hypothetical protein